MANYKPKTQQLCPKCFKMYCEGFWGEGVCTSDMFFGSDMTAAGDAEAMYLRQWYEAHREGFWEHRKRRWEVTADNLMIGLINEIDRIRNARLLEMEVEYQELDDQINDQERDK